MRVLPWPLLTLLATAGLYGRYYWITGRFLVSTDDAYVQAHSVLISPKVSGYISEVPVDDNQSVRAGEILARIDAGEHFARLHRLIVIDRNFGEIARHFGADQDRMRLYIGVIGRYQKAARLPVVITINGSCRKKHPHQSPDQQAL